VEIAELAIRDFLKRLAAADSPEDFLKSKCEEHSIMVSLNQPQDYYHQIILGHIAGVYHLFETFLYEMQAEFNHICGTKWAFEQGRTKLAQTTAFFESKSRYNQTDKIPSYLIDTVDYYHQLRVYFSHKKTTSEAEINQKYKKAKAHYQDDVLLLKYKISNSPRVILALTFEDFFLFTQVVKELALQISSTGYPDSETFAKLPPIKKINKYSDKVPRVTAYLRTEFGFVKENDSDTLAEQIVEHL
jgi:hypothetical protein